MMTPIRSRLRTRLFCNEGRMLRRQRTKEKASALDPGQAFQEMFPEYQDAFKRVVQGERLRKDEAVFQDIRKLNEENRLYGLLYVSPCGENPAAIAAGLLPGVMDGILRRCGESVSYGKEPAIVPSFRAVCGKQVLKLLFYHLFTSLRFPSGNETAGKPENPCKTPAEGLLGEARKGFWGTLSGSFREPFRCSLKTAVPAPHQAAIFPRVFFHTTARAMNVITPVRTQENGYTMRRSG